MALCDDVSYDWLPESFKNCVTAFKELSSSNFEAMVSTSASTKEDMAQWLDEFEQRTKTKWRVRHTYPNVKGWAYRLDLVCQHSSFNKGKTLQTTKNCNCPAKLLQKVSLSTQCMQEESLNGRIELHNTHNHSTDTAASLLQLPITTETQQQFLNYFDNGMCVSEAIKYHVGILELHPDVSEALLANASINPKYRTVRYLYDQWRQKNLGPRAGGAVLQMLEEKLASYQQLGNLVALHKDPLAVVIMTPIMQRASTLRESSQIVFVDSTGSCDSENHCLTFVMAPCAAGAVPLAVLITSGQSTAEYQLVFSLFRTIIGPTGFGGQGYPLTFMTDDSEAEHAALMSVWPESKSRLCLFHVQQAVWRWLWDSRHSIKQEDRKPLMQSFQKLVRCHTEEAATELYAKLVHDDILWAAYPQWLQYVDSYWSRRHLWCMAWREKTMMGHDTNNFCEVTIRLYKDIVLGRCKAYNIVTLIDFTCTVMEDYYRNRLRAFSQGRVSKPETMLKRHLKNAAYVDAADIVAIGSNMYRVPSENADTKLVSYIVNCELGTCTCPSAASGKFCKHQAAVWRHTGSVMPSFPPLSSSDRHQMAILALGEKAEALSFYNAFKEEKSQSCSKSYFESSIDVISKDTCFTDPSVTLEDTAKVDAVESDANFKAAIQMMLDLHSNFGSSKSGTDKILKRLKHVTTSMQWETFLHTQGVGVNCTYRSGSMIRVQPTSLSRRRPNVTRGSKRIPAGRPPLSAAQNHRRKRLRSLGTNVSLNQPNASSH